VPNEPSEPRPDVAVVLVGLNARDYIKQCLGSLATAEWRGLRHEIVYVDNGSTDDTLAMLRAGFPDVRVIANDRNLGFCKAANQGAAVTSVRYLFFLNDDTIVLGDAIAVLVEFLDRTPGAAIVGSRLLYPDMTEQWSGRKFPTLANALLGRRSFLTRIFPNAAPVVDYLCKEQLAAGVPFEVDWISAAALMVRSEAFAAVGGFAEDYYYWHEPVFCDRVAKRGGAVYLHPMSKIIHFEGKGSGPRPFPVQKFHILNFHDGAYRCYCEHHGLKPYNPARWLVYAALQSRAALLLTSSWLRSRRTAST
jgi:GT2 family glycosyltransferase